MSTSTGGPGSQTQRTAGPSGGGGGQGPDTAGPTDGARVAAALDRLRAGGERVTPARRAVLEVVAAADASEEHLTAEQIGARVAEVAPSVHRATVYRTLTSLTELGVLSHVHLGGSATVYHLAPSPDTEADVAADARGASRGEAAEGHAHVQCHACGRVLDVPPHVLDDAARRLQDDLGFVLDTSHAALLGTCAECVADHP